MSNRRQWHITISLLLLPFTVLVVYKSYEAKVENDALLSPQGCRMSYMSPSYVFQSEFNASWTPLAKRYSLWLYREVGWDSEKPDGSPALFIPGNAGSSRQVRSIASSATRQYYTVPNVRAQEFIKRQVTPVDFFAVEFNEDLSALHGDTLLSQQNYVKAALDYIVSFYPKGTKVLIIAHSMGGPVSLSLLPSDLISAVITMASPNSLPPARFDTDIETFYNSFRRSLSTPLNDTTAEAPADKYSPVLSLCGGAPDALIPSETCYLPDPIGQQRSNTHSWRRMVPYRETVFTSSLEGVWSGVGHQEIVWCHQVRWRIARAALDLTATHTVAQREAVLDSWFGAIPNEYAPSGPLGPPLLFETSNISNQTQLMPETRLHIPASSGTQQKDREKHMYLLPISSGFPSPADRLVLFLSRGSLGSPDNYPDLGGPGASFRVKLYSCASPLKDSMTCQPWSYYDLRRFSTLVPIPIRGKPFPVPNEGPNEDDVGIIVEADLQDVSVPGKAGGWIGVEVEGRVEPGRSGLVGLVERKPGEKGVRHLFVDHISALGLVLGSSEIALASPGSSSEPLIHRIRIRGAVTHSLLVYKLHAKTQGDCERSTILPLLRTISPPAESHYYPLSNRSIYLHSHSIGPFTTPAIRAHGLIFDIYSDTKCFPSSITISLDLKASLGRAGVRYWGVPLIWRIAVFALSCAVSWHRWEGGARFPSIQITIQAFIRSLMVPCLFGITALSALPLPVKYVLGNAGEPLLALLGPLCLLLATGYVVVSGYVVNGLVRVLEFVLKIFKLSSPVSRHNSDVPKRKWKTLGMILAGTWSIQFLVPPPVTFISIFLVHLWSCAAQSCQLRSAPTVVLLEMPAPPHLIVASRQEPGSRKTSPSEEGLKAVELVSAALPESSTAPDGGQQLVDRDSAHNINVHLLLIQFLLLPLTAPGLASWIRTLATAGPTYSFGSLLNKLVNMWCACVIYEASSGVAWTRIDHGSNGNRWWFLRYATSITLWTWGLLTLLVGVRRPDIVFSSALGLVLALFCRNWAIHP